MGIVADIEDGCVFRVPKAYPIYDCDYRDYLAIVKEFIRGLENYQPLAAMDCTATTIGSCDAYRLAD